VYRLQLPPRRFQLRVGGAVMSFRLP